MFFGDREVGFDARRRDRGFRVGDRARRRRDVDRGAVGHVVWSRVEMALVAGNIEYERFNQDDERVVGPNVIDGGVGGSDVNVHVAALQSLRHVGVGGSRCNPPSTIRRGRSKS